MMREHAIQHRTTKRYLAVAPSAQSTGIHEVIAPVNAARFTDRQHADRELDALGEFKGAYVVVNLRAQLARTPRILTKDTASIVDLATAWNAVEAAQTDVNNAARLRETPEVITLDRAALAWRNTNAAPGSAASAALWRDVREKQLALNTSAGACAWCADEITVLDATLAYYAMLGGDPARAPGEGGNA